jgi:beta-glucosidase
MASTKHFAVNNQETERMTINARVGERALHEIYLPAFAASVRAGTLSVMAAYNKINGFYAAENDYLLNQVLKKNWGFTGFVVSDWGATHSTVESANNGLDVEMPSGKYFGDGKLQEAVKEKKVAQRTIDDKVRRVLRAMFAAGLFERKASDRPPRSIVGGFDHRNLALRMAQEGIVLLKNDGILPLKPGRVRSVAVLGPNAVDSRSGGGSSRVTPVSSIDPLAGLRERAGASLKVNYVAGVKFPGDPEAIDSSWLSPPQGKGRGHGLLAEYFNNMELRGRPIVSVVEPELSRAWDSGPENFSVRWTGSLRVPRSGRYNLAVRSDDGARLWVDGKNLIDDWADHGPVTHVKNLALETGRAYDVRLEYYQHGGGAMVQFGWLKPVLGEVKKAAAAAAKADVALVFVGYSDKLESEGLDRASLELPEGQDELIEAAVNANKNVVVVVQGGSPVLMDRWADKVKAIVYAWYPGQEGGLAIADILLGLVNPSGKLPVTFPRRWEDSSAFGNYPGHDGAVDYAEGVFVGYRRFDREKISPRFPFGYGLSYTSFVYSNMAVKVLNDSASSPEAEVSLDITNTGRTAGAEVAQLYVHDASPVVERPEAELKGFSRVELAPGETKRISLRLDRSAFAFYDESLHDWRAAPGAFELRAGASSRDVRLVQTITLK